MTDTDLAPNIAEGIVGSERPRGAWIAVLFAVTSFLGAALLFMVQPLAARLILPSFGGSATVWSTSSLFFQVLLLVGYVYAHVATRTLGAWWQPRIHLVVLALPLLVLPIALPQNSAPSSATSPVIWLLWVLTLLVGLPFVVLAGTGPLIQRWYAWSNGPRAQDPYFLFAGSNLGSFVGLLSYPFLIEPHLSLSQQRMGWSLTFGAFLLLMAVCALAVRVPRLVAQQRILPAPGLTHKLAAQQVWAWGALAFLPSCLMLAVTAHLSTDVASIPLLWVLPLSAYLMSFVAAFARSSRTVPLLATRAAVAFSFTSAILAVVATGLPIIFSVIVDVITVGLVSYAAHARLAATRPDPAHLTMFYLVLSAGGAAGGLLNGVVAPTVFDRVWEYGGTLAFVPLLLVGTSAPVATWWRRRYHPVFRTLVMTPLVLGAGLSLVALLIGIGHTPSFALMPAALCLVIAVGAASTRAPVALSLALAMTTLGVGAQAYTNSELLDRTFYGSYRVTSSDGVRSLVHGTTVHGTQFLSPELRNEPTTYYVSDGPLGDAMRVAPARRTAVVGLGSGAIAAYGTSGQQMTFFEIDPAIVRIAEDPDYFTYLADSAAAITTVVGDGRLGLAGAGTSYDLVILDAFSSDSIPVHLLTREAMREYAAHLEGGGSLMVHISNRIFDLEPVLAAAARDLGWHAFVGEGGDGPGSVKSKWVLLTDSNELSSEILGLRRWRRVDPGRAVVWTDDYSSVLSVLR